MSDTCKTQDCDSPVAPEHDMCLMCGQREQIRVLADRVKELEGMGHCANCQRYMGPRMYRDDPGCDIQEAADHMPISLFGCALFEKKDPEKDLTDAERA